MGIVDRIIRTPLALVIGILFAAGTISATLALMLGIFTIVVLLTGAVSVCPLCAPLTMSTIGKKY
jgi:hypothetical protein